MPLGGSFPTQKEKKGMGLFCRMPPRKRGGGLLLLEKNWGNEKGEGRVVLDSHSYFNG